MTDNNAIIDKINTKPSIVSKVYSIIFKIDPDSGNFDKRGFVCKNEDLRVRIENINSLFLKGYAIAIKSDTIDEIIRRVSQEKLIFQGFMYEGASMGMCLRDMMTPWQKNLWKEYHERLSNHLYMTLVGVGFFLARSPFNVSRFINKYNPLWKWLIVDGFGFNNGFFKYKKTVEQQKIPSRLKGYARQAFDQGLGRSLWFSLATDVDRVTQTIHSFPEHRHSDLWSGVGLACAYAGNANDETILNLIKTSGEFRYDLAQGVVFAAMARFYAKNPADHTNMACSMICGTSPDVVLKLINQSQKSLPPDTPEVPAFEILRRRIKDGIRSGTYTWKPGK